MTKSLLNVCCHLLELNPKAPGGSVLGENPFGCRRSRCSPSATRGSIHLHAAPCAERGRSHPWGGPELCKPVRPRTPKSDGSISKPNHSWVKYCAKSLSQGQRSQHPRSCRLSPLLLFSGPGQISSEQTRVAFLPPRPHRSPQDQPKLNTRYELLPPNFSLILLKITFPTETVTQ